MAQQTTWHNRARRGRGRFAGTALRPKTLALRLPDGRLALALRLLPSTPPLAAPASGPPAARRCGIGAEQSEGVNNSAELALAGDCSKERRWRTLAADASRGPSSPHFGKRFPKRVDVNRPAIKAKG